MGRRDIVRYSLKRFYGTYDYNVAIFNNSGTGIWNAHTAKEAKLLRYIISFKTIATCLYCRGKILIMYLPKFL